MKKRLFVAALLADLPVSAATITFTFNGAVNTGTVQRSLDGGTTWSANMTVGQMRVTVSSYGSWAGEQPLSFYSFCVEPQQSISPGTSYTYTIDPLDAAPTNQAPGMGTVKADLLRELYGRYYPSFFGAIAAVDAAALQVATWEIVRETSGTYDVTTGSTRFQNPSNAAILTTANTMLASLNSAGPLLAELYSIRNATNQDLAFHGVPEPATWVIVAGGLSQALWGRRPRR